MAHETETGEWPEDVPVLTEVGRSIKARAHGAQSLSVDQSDRSDRSINKPLPWFVILAAASFLALGLAIATSFRVTDNVQNQQALIKNANDRAYDAQTQSLLLRDYVDHLRIEMASHGIKPPDYPPELRKPK